MPRHTRGRKYHDDDEDATANSTASKDMLELLAKTLASELASKLSLSATSSIQAPPRPPPPFATTNAPSAVRTLTTPKLGSPDTLTIPQFKDWKQRWNDFANAQTSC